MTNRSENYEQYKSKFINYLERIKDCFDSKVYEELRKFLLREPNEKTPAPLLFLYAPASTKFHCNYEGGLMEHSVNVVDNLLLLTEKMNLKWQRPESPIIIGLLHDICKTYDYEVTYRNTKVKNEFTGRDEWVQVPQYVTNDLLPFGNHGDKSVMMLVNMGLKLTQEEMACIRYHMGYSEGQQIFNAYGNAKSKWFNCLWTNVADEMSAHSETVIK